MGVLLFTISLFRLELFTRNDFTVILMKIWVPASVLVMVVAVSRFFNIRWIWMLLPVLLIEIATFSVLQAGKHKAEMPGSLLYFAREVYSINERNIPPYNRELGRYDTSLFYTLNPGVHEFDNLEFYTTMKVNQAGFRDDEASMQRPSIVCLGDSYTMGWGVENEETFADLVERKLNRKTLNLGVASYGTAREYTAFKKYVPDSCDLIILQYCGNDADENAAFVKNQFKVNVSSEKHYKGAQLGNRLFRNYFPLKYFYASMSFTAREGRRWLTGQNHEKEKSNPSSLVATGKAPEWADNFFKKLALLTTNHSGKIIIFNVERFDTTPEIQVEFQNWLSAHKMKDVYLFPAASCLSPEDYFNLDDHLAPSGHRKIAEGLVQFIQSNHILD